MISKMNGTAMQRPLASPRHATHGGKSAVCAKGAYAIGRVELIHAELAELISKMNGTATQRPLASPRHATRGGKSAVRARGAYVIEYVELIHAALALSISRIEPRTIAELGA